MSRDLVLDGELADLDIPTTTEPVTEGTSPTTVTNENKPRYFVRNLTILGEAFMQATEKLFENSPNGNLTRVVYPEIQVLLSRAYIPYSELAQIVDLNGVDSRRIARINVRGFPKRMLREIVVGEYGPDIANAGFFEDLGLTGEEAIKDAPGAAIDCFPELSPLFKFDQKIITLGANKGVNSPYLGLLTIPDLQARAFLTGAIAKSNPSEGKLIDGRHLSPTALDVKDILAYAIEVGEVEKTRHYLDIYRGRP